MIVGVQHILETTHAMFRSLYKLGLKPQNISIIGKCYSTCREVYEEMIADPGAAVERIAAMFGLSASAVVNMNRVAVAVQRDADTEVWRERYRVERGDPNWVDSLAQAKFG